ncbi:6-phosphogluconolactonase [Acetobacter papayae]|uniref:6-phosphogluconolactonase n=1 Tax=Acetobacter papayae TaxID=1076592 RepID=UPI0039EC5A8E
MTASHPTAATGPLKVFPDSTELVHTLAEHLLTLALGTLAKEGADRPFRIALSGGTSPQALYKLMASPAYASRFPWAQTQFFVVDDRFVPYSHEDSNGGMLQRLLFERVPLPKGNVFLMPDSGEPAEAARSYEATLRQVTGLTHLPAAGDATARPLLDVSLMGMGSDGHTASLFPGQDVLTNHTDWVSYCTPTTAPHTRLTLTYPAIAASRHVIFLVTGEDKQTMMARVRAQDLSLPTTAIAALRDVTWFMDQAALPPAA